MSYVYILSEPIPPLYTTGFFDPDGKWNSDKDYSDPEDAAKRVNYLNGGLAEKAASICVGEQRMKKKVLSLLQGCLPRDPTLQKAMKAVEGL